MGPRARIVRRLSRLPSLPSWKGGLAARPLTTPINGVATKSPAIRSPLQERAEVYRLFAEELPYLPGYQHARVHLVNAFTKESGMIFRRRQARTAVCARWPGQASARSSVTLTHFLFRRTGRGGGALGRCGRRLAGHGDVLSVCAARHLLQFEPPALAEAVGAILGCPEVDRFGGGCIIAAG
ncbi:hypothetical protein ADL29_18735 [Streptomyces chattanoogensis]|uniref:Uncharacterized protein n=1 Tax=Streptomyces chattanoogensis TaxID=66876 RepID=A0A0N0XWN3_9ACTN|nr:hypothetical protein ADL29_18735 [Streptomyces chattanoogensis]